MQHLINDLNYLFYSYQHVYYQRKKLNFSNINIHLNVTFS